MDINNTLPRLKELEEIFDDTLLICNNTLSPNVSTHGKNAPSSSKEVKANAPLLNLLDTDTFDSPVDTFPYEFFDSDDESDEICKINNLEDLIKSKDFSTVISLEVAISPGELLLMILKFCIVNHLPQTAMSNLIALINTIFVKPILPQSRYRLDKLFNPKDEAEFHATCPECSGYVGKVNNLNLNTVCDTCNTSIDLSKPSCENLFLIINPSIAIKEILENNADYYDYVVNKRVSEEHNIKDIFDGHMYRDFVNMLPDEDKHCYATTSFNTDGANRFKSSQFSAWPIYLMLHEIPPQDRFNNLITCGLWFNKKKPNMTLFLDPFVDVMNDVATTGIACTIKNKELTIKVFTLICCVDTVARAPAQGFMQFNAKYGCNWCLHPGLWSHGSMRYIITSEIISERDVDSTLHYMKQSVEDPQYTPTFGIKNVSALINLKYFHIINGFVPDYMHCCLAGVGKQITNCLIAPKDVDYFQNLLQNIKSPHQITRLTRPLSDRNYWKCREWENWILYYSIPLLSFKIESEYVKYWSLFVESLHILLQTNISYAELDKADAMLHEFVFKTEHYFGQVEMTYNIHQLLHLAKSVRNWGPLWAHSAFAFENGNHHILQAIKCSKGVIYQILRYINMNRSVTLLEKCIYSDSSEAVKVYCNYTMTTRVKKCIKLSDVTYFGKGITIDEELATRLSISTTSQAYMRMIKNGCLYASSLKINLRSNNSIAQIQDGRFVKIKKFIVDVDEKIELTVCNVINHSDHNLSRHYQILRAVTNVEENTTIIPTRDIQTICILIEIYRFQYICPLPNLLFY